MIHIIKKTQRKHEKYVETRKHNYKKNNTNGKKRTNVCVFLVNCGITKNSDRKETNLQK